MGWRLVRLPPTCNYSKYDSPLSRITVRCRARGYHQYHSINRNTTIYYYHCSVELPRAYDGRPGIVIGSFGLSFCFCFVWILSFFVLFFAFTIIWRDIYDMRFFSFFPFFPVFALSCCCKSLRVVSYPYVVDVGTPLLLILLYDTVGRWGKNAGSSCMYRIKIFLLVVVWKGNQCCGRVSLNRYFRERVRADIFAFSFFICISFLVF